VIVSRGGVRVPLGAGAGARPAGPGGGASAFADLSDVDFAGVADGDVPTWDAGTSKLVPAAPSGGGAVALYVKTLTVGDGTGGTYTPAQLAAGVTLFTPAVGDVIVNAWPLATTLFDGTSVEADIGKFPATGSYALKGMFYWYQSHGWDLKVGPVTNEGDGLGFDIPYMPSGLQIPDLVTAALFYNADGTPLGSPSGYAPVFRSLDTDPIKVVISQDGTKDGTPIDSTVGTVVVYVIVHPAAAMIVV